MLKAISNILPSAEAVQRLLHPYAEVVIHDIQKNQIAAIYNSFSKRKVGDSSLLTEEEQLTSLENCIGPYEKINWDGRKLKSVSSIIRDNNGKAVGMWCINLDISQLGKMQEVILQFLSTQALVPQPEPLFKDDWQEKVNRYVHSYLTQHALRLESLSRQEKQQLISHLHEVGAFTAKNAAHYIAQVLSVSRATIYNYLNTL